MSKIHKYSYLILFYIFYLSIYPSQLRAAITISYGESEQIIDQSLYGFMTFDETDKPIQNKKYGEALLIVSEKINNDINIFRSYITRWYVYTLSGDDISALNEVNISIKLFPEQKNLFIARAITNINSGKYTDAKKDLAAAESNHNYFKYYRPWLEGNITCKQGLQKIALEHYVRAMKRYDKHVIQWNQRALANLGLYNGSIDGIFGRQTLVSLNTWVKLKCPAIIGFYLMHKK